MVAAACGPKFESSVITCDEARAFAYTPARRGDPVERSGPIVAGEEIPVYRIERITYDADELAHRAMLLACSMSDDVLATDELLTWADEASTTTFADMSSARALPFTRPLNDAYDEFEVVWHVNGWEEGYLEVTRGAAGCSTRYSPVDEDIVGGLSVSDATEVAYSLVDTLGALDVVTGTTLSSSARVEASYCTEGAVPGARPEDIEYHLDEYRFGRFHRPADIATYGIVSVVVDGSGGVRKIHLADRHLDRVGVAVAPMGEAELDAYFEALAHEERGVTPGGLRFTDPFLGYQELGDAVTPTYSRGFIRGYGDPEYRSLSVIDPEAGFLE